MTAICVQANVSAFLDMLAYSEGTDNGKQTTKDRGYDVIVGGMLFEGYKAHPKVYVHIPAYKLKSSAAGRYQMIFATWNALRMRLQLPDFSPTSQDRACVELLRECKALPLIQEGRFDEAVRRAATLWASLPGSNAGQRVEKIERLRAVYRKAGGAF